LCTCSSARWIGYIMWVKDRVAQQHGGAEREIDAIRKGEVSGLAVMGAASR
jgi:hypothetical protein